VLGQGLTLPRVDNSGGNTYFYSANLSRLFELGGKRRWRMDIARATTDVTTSQYNDQVRTTLLAVKQAFTTMLLAKETLRLTEDNLNDYRRQVELNRARLNAGDISETDFERIDLQLAGFENDATEARLNLEQAGYQLQLLMGYDRPARSFDISGPLTAPEVSQTMEQLEQEALQARPDYLAAQQSVTLADAGVGLADANSTTDPTLATEYELNGPAHTIGASVSIPLRIFDRNQGERARTRLEAQSSRFAATAARIQVLSDVDSSYAALEAASAMARRYNSRYLKEAENVRNNLEFSYRRGAASLVDYLQALASYRQTSLDALGANAQVWFAIHQLSYAAATEILP
jgi:cobalt-zinc-cadmium efflux system outer membrane protein